MLTDPPKSGNPTVPPFAAAGAALAGLGLIVWIWTGEWRYVATGLVLMVLVAMIPTSPKRRGG